MQIKGDELAKHMKRYDHAVCVSGLYANGGEVEKNQYNDLIWSNSKQIVQLDGFFQESYWEIKE